MRRRSEEQHQAPGCEGGSLSRVLSRSLDSTLQGVRVRLRTKEYSDRGALTYYCTTLLRIMSYLVLFRCTSHRQALPTSASQCTNCETGTLHEPDEVGVNTIITFSEIASIIRAFNRPVISKQSCTFAFIKTPSEVNTPPTPRSPTNPTATMPSQDEIAAAQKTLYEAGLEVRRAVAGSSYVDAALENGSSDFARPMQEYASSPLPSTMCTRSAPLHQSSRNYCSQESQPISPAVPKESQGCMLLTQ